MLVLALRVCRGDRTRHPEAPLTRRCLLGLLRLFLVLTLSKSLVAALATLDVLVIRDEFIEGEPSERFELFERDAAQATLHLLE